MSRCSVVDLPRICFVDDECVNYTLQRLVDSGAEVDFDAEADFGAEVDFDAEVDFYAEVNIDSKPVDILPPC